MFAPYVKTLYLIAAGFVFGGALVGIVSVIALWGWSQCDTRTCGFLALLAQGVIAVAGVWLMQYCIDKSA